MWLLVFPIGNFVDHLSKGKLSRAEDFGIKLIPVSLTAVPPAIKVETEIAGLAFGAPRRRTEHDPFRDSKGKGFLSAVTFLVVEPKVGLKLGSGNLI